MTPNIQIFHTYNGNYIKFKDKGSLSMKGREYKIENNLNIPPICAVTASYCEIFENMGEGISIFEVMRDEKKKIVDLRVNFVNPASILNKLKFREEIIGKNITELFEVDKASLYLETASKVISTGNEIRYEAYFAQLNRHFLINAFSLNENIYVTIDVDVTREKNAENELFKSEKKFRTLFENSNDAIIIIDHKTGKHIDANRKAEEITGYSKKELTSMNAGDLTSDNRKERVMGWFKKLQEKNRRIECEILTKNLKRIPVEASATLVEIEGSLYIQVLFRDITERKEARKELKEAHDKLELKVQERTVELEESNKQLKQEIEERKKAEERIGRLANIVESSDDAIISLTLNGTIRSWNKGAENVYGYLACEMIGKKPYILIDPSQHEYVDKCINKLEKGEKIACYIAKRLRKDGKEIYVSVKLSPIKNSNGAITGVSIIVRDITKRKTIENALKESEEKYRSIFENSMDAIFLTCPDGSILDTNRAAEEMYGYTKEEICKLGRSGIFDTTDPRLHEAIKEGAHTGKFRSEYYSIRKDGTKFLADVTGKLFKDNEGNDKGIIIMRDVTERKKAEEEIKRSNLILKGITQIFRDALTVKTDERLGKTCLAVCEKVTGSKFGFICEINEEKTLDTLAISDSGWNECKMAQSNAVKFIKGMKIHGLYGAAIRRGRPVLTNNPGSHPDSIGTSEGHPPVKAYLGFPLKYGNEIMGVIGLANKKRGYTLEDQESVEILSVAIVEALMSFRSRNAVKEYRDQLEETVEELRQSNDELRQFAYITSHDIQEPLRTIASFTQLLERRYKCQLDSDADEFIDFIIAAAVRMKEMIQGLLDYSHIETSDRLKPVDTEKILKTVLSDLHVAIEENKVEIIHDPLPTVIADRNQLIQLFQNLIGNAIKFKKQKIPPKIHISCQKDEKNKEYIFSVSDNGIGMESQYKNRIFEVFKRLHTIEEYEGAGIGLAISKRIVECHGGRIWVESEHGLGSTFYFNLPIRGENNAFKKWGIDCLHDNI